MAIRRPGLPSVPQSVDPKVRVLLMALKESTEIANGVRTGTGQNQDGWMRRSVTLGMLIKLGLVTEEQARSVWQEP